MRQLDVNFCGLRVGASSSPHLMVESSSLIDGNRIIEGTDSLSATDSLR